MVALNENFKIFLVWTKVVHSHPQSHSARVAKTKEMWTRVMSWLKSLF